MISGKHLNKSTRNSLTNIYLTYCDASKELKKIFSDRIEAINDLNKKKYGMVIKDKCLPSESGLKDKKSRKSKKEKIKKLSQEIRTENKVILPKIHANNIKPTLIKQRKSNLLDRDIKSQRGASNKINESYKFIELTPRSNYNVDKIEEMFIKPTKFPMIKESNITQRKFPFNLYIPLNKLTK